MSIEGYVSLFGIVSVRLKVPEPKSFMYKITFESSERSDTLNWVKKYLVQQGFGLMSFEGYTVKNSQVSLLLDRGLFEIDCSTILAEQLTASLEHVLDLSTKMSFAKRLGCPYLFFCYSYTSQNCAIFELTEDGFAPYQSFESWVAFAEWTKKYRDLVMSSRFEESGLPNIDVELRASGTPWPGNLDYLLLKDGLRALIEFQRTTASTVAQHCNNRWFLPSFGRKGDVNRWRVIDIIRDQSKLPLVIIVWSTAESVVKLKFVEKIIYPEDPAPQKGLVYSFKEVVSKERMIEVLSGFDVVA